MREIYIKYNPYTVHTDFIIEGKPVDKLSALYSKKNTRLQEWIEPSEQWKGFFHELFMQLNSKTALNIVFHGTELDFEDLKYAAEKYGKSLFEDIQLSLQSQNNQKGHIQEIEKKFQELKDGPIEELRTDKIQTTFKTALSSEFEIVIVAPMSSGKSTLINAILGQELLPTANTATTATLTRIKDVDGMENFKVSCVGLDGRALFENKTASSNLIKELNNQADNLECINIEGDIPNIPSNNMNLVFVDTPGGDNSQNQKHGMVMRKAIRSENKGMILFVFDLTHLENDACNSILEIIADTIKNSHIGKQARDRFIFVCNKMDEQKISKEPYEEIISRIKNHLSKFGIEDPNLFLVSAETCKMIRMKKAGIVFDDEDDIADYRNLLEKFNRDSRRLFEYSSIPEKIKEKFNDRIEKLRKENISDDDFKTKAISEIAEINSGIPALELAIKNYIEKYAVAIKVKCLHDTFMNQAKELDVANKYMKKLVQSEGQLNIVKQEADIKEKQLEKNQGLKKFKERIDSIQFQRDEIEELKEKAKEELLTISNEYEGEMVSVEAAERILTDYQKKLQKLIERIGTELENKLEKKINFQCRKIIDEYQDYLMELDQQGLFQIGEFSFRSLSGLDQLGVNNLTVDSIESKYITQVTVEQRAEKKKGFLNMVYRIFGKESGWNKVMVKKRAIKVTQKIAETSSLVESKIYEYIDEQLEMTEKSVTEIKKFVKEYLEDIENKVKEEIKKVKKIVSDKKELEKIFETNKENAKWLAKFLQEMDNILEI